MRGLRVLSVCALALSLAAVPTAHAASVTTAPDKILAVDGTTADPGLARDDVFSGPSLQVRRDVPSEQISFIGNVQDGTGQGQVEVDINPNGGGSFAEGTTYPVADDSNQAGTVSVFLTTGSPGYCRGVSGSVAMPEVQTDPDSGKINAFAASFTIQCSDSGATEKGTLRFHSSEPFDAVSVSPRSWDFGTQLAHRDGTPRTFTFADRGTNPVTYAAAKLAGGAPKNFKIRHDGCHGRTITAGHSCTVTVVPHPHRADGSSPASTTLELPTTSGLRTRLAQLSVTGDDMPSVHTVPGPDRIALAWHDLPQQFGGYVERTKVYRGTSAAHLTYLKRSAKFEENVTDHSVAPGRTYYYQVAPVFNDGTTGTKSPVIAAIAWPKYSAGMYHKVKPAHLVHHHVVKAGHPYSFQVLGHHGIPKSGVSAVALDLVAEQPSSATQLTVYPFGTHRPKAADLAARAGRSASNFVIAAVGKHGKATVSTAHGLTPVTLDVSGYYSAGNLSHHFGPGAAQHIFARQGTLADTKRYQKAPLPSGYFLRVPVNFNAATAPRVTSVLVQITAYGSKADGTISAYAADKHPASTTALAYRAGASTTNTAIVPITQVYDESEGRNLPAMSFLNRGRKPVQLFVTILGFYDDDTLTLGQRYSPTRPVHLTTRHIGSGSPATLRPGSHADIWSTSLNVKIAASQPSSNTTLSLAPFGFKHAVPPHPLMHLSAGQPLIASTPQPLGTRNNILVRNGHGHVALSVWSFGRFEAWPFPRHTPSYAAVEPAAVVPMAARAQH
jgi:hypothetical protein